MSTTTTEGFEWETIQSMMMMTTPSFDSQQYEVESIPEQSPQLDNSNSKDNSTHNVSFGVVEIREYPIILGDHPSARYGVPLTIDWEYEEGETMSVVDFDAAHGPYYKKMREMRMSPYYKRTLLRELQYSGKELKEREREMLKIQRQRQTTKFFVRIQRFEEKFTKTLKNGIQKGSCCRSNTTVMPVMNDQELGKTDKHFEDMTTTTKARPGGVSSSSSSLATI